MSKIFRRSQDRYGNPERRRLEFKAVVDQVERRKKEFIARLEGRLEQRGACRCYRGSLDHKGYARLNIRYKGENVTIHAHRLFLILKIRKPIPRGFEAGHLPGCRHRTCVAHLRLEHYSSNAATAG